MYVKYICFFIFLFAFFCNIFFVNRHHKIQFPELPKVGQQGKIFDAYFKGLLPWLLAVMEKVKSVACSRVVVVVENQNFAPYSLK